MGDTPKVPGAFTDETDEAEKYLERLAEQARRQKELEASLEARLKTISELAPIELKYLNSVNDLLKKENEELRARTAEVEKGREAILETNKILARSEEIAKNKIRLERETLDLTIEKDDLERAAGEATKTATQEYLRLEGEKRGAAKKMAEALIEIKKIEEEIIELKHKDARADVTAQENLLTDQKNILNTEKQKNKTATDRLETIKEELKLKEKEGSDEEKKAAKKAREYAEQRTNLDDRIEANRNIVAQEENLLTNARNLSVAQKEELKFRLHNERAAEIQLRTQEKIFSIIGKTHRLQDSFIGSFIAGLQNSEKSIGGILGSFTKQFENIEVAYGTFFKTVENGLTSLSGKFMNFVNFEKDLILGADKAAAAFNKATGRGTEFRNVIEKINTEQTISTNEFSKYNVSLDRVLTGYSDLYTSFNKFKDLNAKTQIELAFTAQKFNNIGLNVQKLGSLATQLGGSFIKTEKDVRDFGQSMADAMIRTGKSMDTLASDFESFKDRFVVYGQTGVKVFNDLQIMAERMGLSFSSLVNVTTAFDKFEEGAKRAGQINAALGGAYVNSLDLMGMKENERIMYLKRSFEQTRMNFGSLNKYSQEFIASAFGIKSVAEAQNLFSMSTAQLTSELAKRNAESANIEKIAKNSADVMEQVKILGQSLLIAFGPIFSVLNFVIQYIKDSPILLAFLKTIAFIGLGIGAIVKTIQLGAAAVALGAAAVKLFQTLSKSSLKEIGEIIMKKEQEKNAQIQLNNLSGERLRTEQLITSEIEKRARLMGINVPQQPSPAPVLSPTTTGGTLVPTSTNINTSVDRSAQAQARSGVAMGASSIAVMTGMFSAFLPEGIAKDIFMIISVIAGIVGVISAIMAAIAGASILPVIIGIIGILPAIAALLKKFKVFDGAKITPDGKITSASDYALSGQQLISAKSEDGKPSLFGLHKDDVGVTMPDGSINFTKEESVLNSGFELTKNNISSVAEKMSQNKSIIMKSEAMQNIAATNRFSTAVSEFTTTTAAGNTATLQLSDEQLDKLAKKVADGAQTGIQGARLEVQGSVNVDGRRFGSLVTDVMKGNALGRS